MERQEYCQACREMPGQTECETCEWKCPELWETNEDAWYVWVNTQSQWRVGMGGVVGLDYTALEFVARTLNTEITPALLKKIRVLEAYMLGRVGKEETHGSQ